MENSSQDTEHIHLDDNRSYLLFYIEGNEIRLSSNFQNEEDMIEILNVVSNTDAAVTVVADGLSKIEGAQLRAILNALKTNNRGKGKPVISPLSMSQRK